MKTVKSFACLLLMTAFMLPCFAFTEDSLPADISGYFTGSKFGAYVILDAAALAGYGGDDCWFVLLRTEANENVLYCFKKKNGVWKHSFHTGSAVPQTLHQVYINVYDDGEEWPDNIPVTVPHLSILQIDEYDEYPELCVTFVLTDGNWLLRRIWSYTDYDSMLIRDGAISYFEDLESSRINGTVYGAIQRDLRYVSLSAIPKTLKEAKNKLTEAPVIPTGELAAQEISFTGGQKYNVYSGPDASSLRGGNGKARVSTNGWIQVFGKEDGWILIQYSIDSGHYRFGYIDAASLPKKSSVPELAFEPVSAWTVENVSVTDDPLYAQSTLASLSEGCPVSLLATMGSWAYIESSAGDLFRGFVPLSSISTDRVFDLLSQSDSHGPVYRGTLTIRAGLTFSTVFTVLREGSLGAAAVATVHLYDGSGTALLCSLAPDENGQFSGEGLLRDGTTAIRFEAVDALGNPLDSVITAGW